MLLKILLTAGLIYIVYIAFFKKPAIAAEKKETKSQPIDTADDMIACAKCGTYISADEAILSTGQSFCSKECLKEIS